MLTLILDVPFLWHFRVSIALESSSHTHLTTWQVKNRRIIIINQSYRIFPKIIGLTLRTINYLTLLMSCINLKDVILLVITFFKVHSDVFTCLTCIRNSCKFNTFNEIYFRISNIPNITIRLDYIFILLCLG